MPLDIRTDHISGASALGNRCLDVLLDWIQNREARSKDEFFQGLLSLGKELIKAQPSMASVFNKVNYVLWLAKRILTEASDIDYATDSIAKQIQQYQGFSEQNLKKISNLGSKLISQDGTVITYSASSTVEAILLHARNRGKKFDVIVPESRPVFEGRQMALRLSERGVRCTLIVDGAISRLIKRAEMALVGADRVTEDSLINKVGTRGLALMAKEASVPLYAAFETDKFLPKRYLPLIDRLEDPSEICKVTNENLKVENLYFEETPLSCFSALITEKGKICPDELGKLAEQLPVVGELEGMDFSER